MPGAGGSTSAWVRRAALGIGLLGGYLGLVGLHGTSVAGVAIGTRQVLLGVGAATAASWALLSGLARRSRVGPELLQSLALGSGMCLLCAVAADIAYTRYLDRVVPGAAQAYFFQDAFRFTDPQVWFGELLPHEFQPTRKNFMLYKPGVRQSADVYGWFYYPAMLASPTLVHSVLESRRVDTAIDARGFRETSPLEASRIFALGDSFTYGSTTTQARTWVEELERRLGEPVYNLGHNDYSPRQELLLLDYLFDTEPERFRPRTVLWMLFGGNDLDDAYDDERPLEPEPLDHSLLRAAPRALGDLGRAIAGQSALGRLLRGEIRLGWGRGRTRGRDPYEVDGVRLTRALYHSPRFGDRLFLPLYLERAARTRADVEGHPHWPRFLETLDAMAERSRERGFDVVVLLAPSAPRLYAASFEDVPSVSESPSFLDLAGQAARERGFAVVDLTRELAPRAAETLLYWRDDSHWNESGHAAVAEIIARALARH